MSTIGNVINCVFNTISELGDSNIGLPFMDIVHNLKANILNKSIQPQPRNIESHIFRAIQYGLRAGIITEPQKGYFKIVEVHRNPETLADEDDADAVRFVEYNDESDVDRFNNDNDYDKDDEYSENEKLLNEHQFYKDDEDEAHGKYHGDYGQSSNSDDQSNLEYDEHHLISSGKDENEADGASEYLSDDDNVATLDNVRNGQKFHYGCGRKNCRRDDNIDENNNARSTRDERYSQSSQSNDRCGPEMRCEPTHPSHPKHPNNPCPPRNPKSPCEPKKPCGPWSPYAPKNPKCPKEPERPKNTEPPTRCVCRPRKYQPKCSRPEPEHFGSHKDEHFEENESDDFDNSVKSYEVDDFKGDFKKNNQSDWEQIGRPSCGSLCLPSGGGSCNDSMNCKKRHQSDSNEDMASKKRYRVSISKGKIDTACNLFENDIMKENNQKNMTFPPEYGTLPKLLPQVIKAIVDLNELNGSTIDDIIDQVKTNMAFYGIRSTTKNIKAQVHLCLRHGVRLGCFRVESQGKFRLNKLKYCVPVLKCVLSPHCVNSAIKSRYLVRHCSKNDQSQQLLQHQSYQRQQQEYKEKLQQAKNQQTQQQQNSKTKKSNLKNKHKRSSTYKNTATFRTHSSSSREVIIEMNTDTDKSILPIFSNPLTSYKKRSNTSAICIYDPAGHMGPQMECKDCINCNDKSTNVQENVDNIPMTTTICRKTGSGRGTATTIRNSQVSTSLSLVTINSSTAATRVRSSKDVRKLKKSAGVLKTLQLKFDQLQKCIWGNSLRNIITPDIVKNRDSSGFTE